MPLPPRFRVALLIVATVAASALVSAQEAAQSLGRPRIGLALGGGSARGLAHIGVLAWFEEHRIPIDMVVGTSMGGLVAGAYATGMSPDEIQQLMLETDWDAMFIADSPFKYKTFRRKEDKRAYPSQLEFGLKGGFRLPSGLNAGQGVLLLLDRIALPYYGLEDFDDLPTPFRCVATDLRTSEPIVLDHGSLSRAMRATMAIPGVFTPVNYDNWLLVDGGALNNVPANVVKELGADFVVAVNVGAEVAGDDETVASLLGLMSQTIDAMMQTTIREALKSANVVVDPDLTGFGSTDWRRSVELAQRGYQAAEAQKDKLLPYAMGEAEYDRFRAARQAKRRTTVPTPTFVEVQPLNSELSAHASTFIARAFEDVVNVPVTHDAIQDDVLWVAGTDRYSYLNYQMVERDGSTGLLIGARPKDYGPPFLAIGLEMSNVDSSSFAVNLGARITTYDTLGTGSEGRFDVVVGTNQALRAEVYQPLFGSPIFIAPRGEFLRYGRNAYVNEAFVAEYRIKRVGGAVDLGARLGRRGEIRVGGEIYDVRGRVRIGSPELPEATGQESALRLRVAYDDQTSPIVPGRGLHAIGTLRRFFSTADPTIELPPGVSNPDNFWQGEVRASRFWRAGGEHRIFVSGGAGSSFGEQPLFNDFLLGGPLRLGAFNNDELAGANYALIDVGYLRQVARMPDIIGGNIYLAGIVESGKAWDDWDEQDWNTDGTVGVVVETLIGPLFGAYSFGEGGGRFYISVGPIFQ
jgi:NTE family protein